MAITSLLLSNGVGGLVPAADVNIDPNNPVDPAAQHLYNTVCIQVLGSTGNRLHACCVIRASRSPAVLSQCSGSHAACQSVTAA